MEKNTKPKLLLISAISPNPQNSGGATRIKNTLKELSKQYQVDFVTFRDNDFQLKDKSLPLFFSQGIPYWFSPWYNPELKLHINNLIKKNNYDLIQIEFSQLLYLSSIIPENIKSVFVAHDISYISFYRRIFEGNPNILKLLFRFIMFLQVYIYEKYYLPKFDTIVTVSEKDKITLKKSFSNNNVACFPNGIEEIKLLNKQKSITINLGYIGSFKHSPNLNAVKFFFDKIAPLLDNQNIKYKFYLAGNNTQDQISQITNSNKLINLGIVKTPQDFYKKIDCLITPIFSGSGSRIKILESLSFGTPIISSPIGAEGINIKTDYLKIANSPEQYLNHINNLPTDNSKLSQKLKPYLWQIIFNSYSNKI